MAELKNSKDLKYIKYLDKANKIHDGKYTYISIVKPDTVLEINCPIHGMFYQKYYNHIYRKNGCFECSKTKLSTEEFTKRANIIHRNKYDYSVTIYQGRKKRLKIKCLIHGIFETYAENHIGSQKSGCPKCADISYNTDSFISLANKIHKNKYNYIKVNYKNIREKIIIGCPEHGDFKQDPNSHINIKCGCPKCADTTSNTDEFIKKSVIVHYDKYNYDKVQYTNAKNKVEIICDSHGLFHQTPNDHLQGHGCPKCNSSKGEIYIKNILEANDISFIEQYKFEDCVNLMTHKKLIFDFYLPKLNICIEYDGIQHFKPIEYFGGEKVFKQQQLNDLYKSQYCDKYNIKLIRFDYKERIWIT